MSNDGTSNAQEGNDGFQGFDPNETQALGDTNARKKRKFSTINTVDVGPDYCTICHSINSHMTPYMIFCDTCGDRAHMERMFQ